MFSLPYHKSHERVNLGKHLACPPSLNHCCWVYETQEEHKTVIVDFVKQGLRNNEKICLIHGSQQMKADIIKNLNEAQIDYQKAIASNQLHFCPSEDVYVPQDVGFVPEIVTAKLEQLIIQANEEGYTRLRAYGDMNFAANVEFKAIHRYESQLVELFSRYQTEMLGLCGFSANVFDGTFITAMMTTHPKLCIGTEDFESNFYYVPEANQRPTKSVAEYWISNLRERKAMMDSLKQKNVELVKMNQILQLEQEERQRVQQEKQEAEDGNRAKRAFIGMLSHEIRTPLFGIISTATLLKDTALTKDQEEYVSMIGAIGEHLMSVLNDVLDFSKFENSKIELEDRPFVLRECVDGVMEIFRKKKDADHILLEYRISESVPESVSGDVTRLRQILINLVGNAIKFTSKEGTVIISTEVESTLKDSTIRPDRIRLKFSVKDNGIGIPKEKFGKIFCDYQQADVSTSRLFGGTGLGLAICKRLVEAMSGAIWFESEVEVGSTFHFTITFNCVSAHQITRKRSIEYAQSPPLKILVAEDNTINQIVIQRMLAKMGHTVKMASTGLEAVENVQRSEYDLILMDLHMPIMDGFEATQRIQQMDWTGKQKPKIIAVTAAVLDEEKIKCQQAGMDGFVNKPLQLEQLQAVCQKSFPENSKHQKSC